MVESKLSIFHGPVPMMSVPGWPMVVLCSSWNFFSKTGNALADSVSHGA